MEKTIQSRTGRNVVIHRNVSEDHRSKYDENRGGDVTDDSDGKDEDDDGGSEGNSDISNSISILSTHSTTLS